MQREEAFFSKKIYKSESQKRIGCVSCQWGETSRRFENSVKALVQSAERCGFNLFKMHPNNYLTGEIKSLFSSL